jgi:hypothetical protein
MLLPLFVGAIVTAAPHGSATDNAAAAESGDGEAHLHP